MLNKKDFLKYASTLAFPIMLQNLIGTLVNVADTVMLGYVSQTAMSASSLANQYTFILFCLYYGMATGTSVLCAQYWGKGDKKTVEKILGLAERISLIVSLVFFVISFSMPTTIMKIFTNSPDTIAAGSEYLKVISFSFMFMGFSQVFMSALRSVGKIMLPSVTYIVSLCVNVLCNASFIFGLFGVPQMGATGVAIATAVSRSAELAACVVVSAFSRDVKLSLAYMFAKNQALYTDFIKMSLPALGNDVSWSVAFSMYSVILGHLGTDAVAANSIVSVVRNIGTVFCFSVASAGSILLGSMMGKGDLEKSKLHALKTLKATVIAGAVGGMIVLAVTPFVLEFATLNDKAMHYLKYMLFINAYYIMGAAVNSVLIAGVFRAGGDTKFGLVCDTIDMWLYAVPLGFIATFILKLPVMWVYFLLCTDEFAKWPWVIHHYRSGKWAQNITREDVFAEKAVFLSHTDIK